MCLLESSKYGHIWSCRKHSFQGSSLWLITFTTQENKCSTICFVIWMFQGLAIHSYILLQLESPLVPDFLSSRRYLDPLIHRQHLGGHCQSLFEWCRNYLFSWLPGISWAEWCSLALLINYSISTPCYFTDSILALGRWYHFKRKQCSQLGHVGSRFKITKKGFFQIWSDTVVSRIRV